MKSYFGFLGLLGFTGLLYFVNYQPLACIFFCFFGFFGFFWWGKNNNFKKSKENKESNYKAFYKSGSLFIILTFLILLITNFLANFLYSQNSFMFPFMITLISLNLAFFYINNARLFNKYNN